MNRPKSITNEQVQKLLRRLEIRERLLIRLGVESGLRVSDLLKLRIGDIKKTMTVYESKSRRERTFKLSAELLQDIKAWTKYKKRAHLLFPSARTPGKPIHRSTVHRKIKRALKGSKINASAHSTRKLYAHNIFSETHDLEKVREALHHRNLATTLTYLDIDYQLFKIANDELQGGDKT